MIVEETMRNSNEFQIFCGDLSAAAGNRVMRGILNVGEGRGEQI